MVNLLNMKIYFDITWNNELRWKPTDKANIYRSKIFDRVLQTSSWLLNYLINGSRIIDDIYVQKWN